MPREGPPPPTETFSAKPSDPTKHTSRPTFGAPTVVGDTVLPPYEILSELSNSPTGTVYKANDPESGQTIALKAIQLSAFGESAVALEQALLAEYGVRSEVLDRRPNLLLLVTLLAVIGAEAALVTALY